MTQKKSEKKELKKLPAKALGRGLSLFNLTVSSGVRLAKLKVGDVFTGEAQKKERLNEFLMDQAQRLVDELGRLKGSIMKAGQMLSVYGEHFFPPEINRVLKTLQAESKPISWEEMEKVIAMQLGDKVEQLDINPEPVAAASMGQVYQARIKKTGELLALKVQYPGVDKAIDSDLKALKTLISLSNIVSNTSGFDEIFKEIRMMLHYEVDYSRELEIANYYRDCLDGDRRFVVPRFYPDFSTKRVIAMSFEEGVAVDSDAVKNLPQPNRNRLAASIMDLMYQEIFTWKMVQTDPHFGNYKIRINPDGHDQIVLLDFGAVRKFPKRYILPFAELVQASLAEDFVGTKKAGLKLGFLQEDDEEKVFNLFYEICHSAVEAFTEEYASPQVDGNDEGDNPYCWGETDLIKRLTALTKDAIFTFRLRPPPREAIFLDRKMVGIFVFISTLKLRMGPRKLLLKYLDEVL